jgi:hypothetical protein
MYATAKKFLGKRALKYLNRDIKLTLEKHKECVSLNLIMGACGSVVG